MLHTEFQNILLLFVIGTKEVKWKLIWANQPIHLFLVGCLNPCLQGTSVWVGSPQPVETLFE